MKKIALSFLLTVFVTSVFAQKTTTRNLKKFTHIYVSEGINVHLIKGALHSAKITANGIDIEDILTEVSGVNLKIHLSGSMHRNVDVSIDLTYVDLEEVTASSAAEVKSTTVIEANVFKIEALSAADIELILKVNDLTVEASSAADVVVSGTTDNQTVNISSASEYKAFDLVSKVATISASSASSAKVQVTENLFANANSGASITYKGSPDKVKEKSLSGGDVEQY